MIFPPVALSLDKSHALGFSRGAFFLLVKILKGNQKGKDKDAGYSLADVRLLTTEI